VILITPVVVTWLAFDIFYLAILASAVPEIWLWA